MPYYVTPRDIAGDPIYSHHPPVVTILNRRPIASHEWRDVDVQAINHPHVHHWTLDDKHGTAMETKANPYFDPTATPVNGVYFPTSRSPYDCGSNDFYYHRGAHPNKKHCNRTVYNLTTEECASYWQGYNDAEILGDQKEYL